MSCNISIDQQPSFSTSDRPAPETKTKDQKRVEAACRGQENYMEIFLKRPLKDYQEVQMTLKEFIDYFEKDLNDPASTLIAMEETISIMKEDHNTEINISIEGTDYATDI